MAASVGVMGVGVTVAVPAPAPVPVPLCMFALMGRLGIGDILDADADAAAMCRLYND